METRVRVQSDAQSTSDVQTKQKGNTKVKEVGGELWGSVLLLGRHFLRLRTHKKTRTEKEKEMIFDRFSVETKVESQENRTKN